MSRARSTALAIAALLLPLAAPHAEDFRETAVKNIERHTGWDEENPSRRGTPFRKALKLKLKDRKERGKRTPKEVVYDAPVLKADPDGLDDVTGEPIGWGPGSCEDRKRCPTRGYVVKFNAVTKLSYGGPDEVHDGKGGGRPEWPPIKVEKYERDPATHEWKPVLDEHGDPLLVDETQAYRDHVTAQGLAEGKVAWKTDPNDPDDPGLYEFGQEPQEEDVTEEITFTFKEEDQAQGEAFFRQLSAAMAAGDVGAEQAILMGFTYTGPNIDYTIGSSRRICIFGCFYLWDIRAGFALDFGLGLRLPAYSRLSGPAQMVAGATYDFSSTIETAPQGDWTPGDWAAPQFSAAGVNPYADRGDPAGEGNELVMFFELFAGAKVKILGVDVCPWCQYVEVNVDYSSSFATPFGAGTRFPLPTVDIPVKDLNFGIVSLTVGLYVTPNVTSTNIGAVSGSQVIAHAASGVPATFPVKACIANEAPAPRFQTISLDAYRYQFDSFQLVLGAYLDFSVLGYGVWSPRFDFLDLDLSSALGSLGLYLPDHRSCSFTFQCAPAPVNQGASVKAELLDASPPSTALALAGTIGKNGWWTSDVAGTLTPVDEPAGCGSGVAATWWGLAVPPQEPGTSLLLTYEDVARVAWRSIDRDGNAELPKEREVKIDKTPPVVGGAATTAPNANGWYKEDVTVHFVASDATSGVAALTPDTILSAEAANQSATGTAEDVAGLTASFTVGGVHIDKTAPAVAVVVPQPKGYANTDTIAVAWTATDALSLVEGEAASLDGTPVAQGQPLELVYLGGGNHVVRATATDRAGNVGGAEVAFLVDVDVDGLLAAVDRVCAEGWVKATGCSGLRAKVLEARASLALGLATDARGQLGAFLNALDAQRGKAVEERAFALLRVDALYVLVRYGLVPSV